MNVKFGEWSIEIDNPDTSKKDYRYFLAQAGRYTAALEAKLSAAEARIEQLTVANVAERVRGDRLQAKVNAAETQIEKLKCCENCGILRECGGNLHACSWEPKP